MTFNTYFLKFNIHGCKLDLLWHIIFCLFHKNLHFFFFKKDNVVEGEMHVDPKHHRYFVARRGEVLKHIADEFGGVTVSFPRSGVKSDRVVIKGSKDCVEGAKKRIQEIVEDLVCIVTNTCYRSFLNLNLTIVILISLKIGCSYMALLFITIFVL